LFIFFAIAQRKRTKAASKRAKRKLACFFERERLIQKKCALPLHDFYLKKYAGLFFQQK